MNNKKDISRIFIMFLISILLTTNTVYASIPENRVTSEISLEELTVENIPEQISDQIDADMEDVVEVSTKDAEDLSSITLVNADNTETVYLFSEPVKYIDEEKNEIKFIDNTINDAKRLNDFINKNAYKSSGNTFDANFSNELSDGIVLNEGEYNENEVHVSYDNYYTVKDMGKGNYLLTMVINQEFMENPDTVYPVLIDPTVMVGQNIEFESSYAFQSGETKSYVNDVLWVGNYSTRGEGITYIKPTGMTSKKYINPDNIISAHFI